MRHPLDDDDARRLGRLRYPPCPHCGRQMFDANIGTEERQKDILVCCDPRCHGRFPKADIGKGVLYTPPE